MTQKLLYPIAREKYCKDKTPASSFADAEYCDQYFKWREAQRTRLPSAAPVNTPQSEEAVAIRNRYRGPGEPDMIMEAESEDKNIKVRRTITFNTENKPIRIKEESIPPASPIYLTYTLNEQVGIDTIRSSDDKLFLSRRREHQQMMTADKIAEMDKYDESLKAIIPFITECDKRAREATAQAVEQPSSLLSSQVRRAEETIQNQRPAPATTR